jgi:ribosomal protein L11 methyltransferase
MTVSEEDLQAAVMAHIQSSQRRQTSAAVTAAISRDKGLPPKRARAAIRSLLNAQRLIFSYEMGCSFLLENTRRCWRPTPNIWILPPKCSLPEIPDAKAIQVRLAAGAAFGSGEHPTTLLCLRALDHLYRKNPSQICLNGTGIDIGTGSGVLALVAAKMGSRSILALDTDPCAREETRANIVLNHLTQCVKVDACSYESIVDSFALILANLRYPTLLKILPWVKEHLLPEGRLVISGYLGEEMDRLKTHYKAENLHMHWRATHKRWAAGIFGLNGS